SNMLVGLISALFSPSRAKAIEVDKARISYWMLLKDFFAALVPFALVAGTLWLTWWYVVIHQQAAAEAAVSGVQQLGTPGLGGAPRTRAAGRLLLLVWAVRRRRHAHACSLLLENGRRPLRGPETSDLFGNAARYSHRRRARRHPVRHHDRDGVRRSRRRRRL